MRLPGPAMQRKVKRNGRVRQGGPYGNVFVGLRIVCQAKPEVAQRDLVSVWRICKKILVEAKNLQSIYEYFLDHFGENDAFLDLGKPKRHPVLEQFIGAIAGEVFGGKAVAASFLLIAVPKTDFVHGAHAASTAGPQT